MSSTFLGVEIARSTLMMSRNAMDVTGHNLANANTEGYSRQSVNLTNVVGAVLDFNPQNVKFGSGVTIESISRSRDAFLDGQYRDMNSQKNFYDVQQSSFSQIEDIVHEPSDSGLVSAIQDFASSLKQDLANNPESSAVRIEVREKAQSLVDRFHDMSQKFTSAQSNIDQQIQAKVTEVNNYLTNITALQKQIDQIELMPNAPKPNDLLDQRDELLDKLSADLNVTVTRGTNDTIKVSVGSNVIINDQTATPITTSVGANGFTALSIPVSGGQIGAMQQMRDQILPQYMSQFDNIAQTLVTSFNQVHAQGKTLAGTQGGNFFNPNNVTAATISLDTGIQQNLDNIAASINGDPGDGSNAINLGNSLLSSASSPLLQYQTMIGQIGVDSQQSQVAQNNSNLLEKQAFTQRDSVSGVSVDEETSNLIKYQYQYQAGAKVLSTVDTILQTLLNIQ